MVRFRPGRQSRALLRAVYNTYIKWRSLIGRILNSKFKGMGSSPVAIVFILFFRDSLVGKTSRCGRGIVGSNPTPCKDIIYNWFVV